MKPKHGLLAVLLVLGCTNLDIEQLPTEVTLTLDRTSASVGEEFTISWEAQGDFLARVILDFGDGTPPDITSSITGAQRASADRTHTYATAGSYTVTATVEEVRDDAPSASDTETVQVTGG
jgi:PKD repeat protein